MHFVLIRIGVDKEENVFGDGTGRREPSEEGLKGAGLTTLGVEPVFRIFVRVCNKMCFLEHRSEAASTVNMI